MTHRSFALKAFIKAENGTGRRKPLARFFASSSAVFQQRLAGKVALTTGSSDGCVYYDHKSQAVNLMNLSTI